MRSAPRWLGCIGAGMLAAAGRIEAEQPAAPSASSQRSATADPASTPASADGANTPPGAAAEPAVTYRALASEAEAMRLADEYLRKLMADDYQGAFDLVRPYFPISAQRFAKLHDEVTKQHGLAELQFGKPIGHVFVDARRIGETVLRYRFLEKFDLDVMYWEFVFYKPQDGWIINGLGFDDTVKDLFAN